MVDECVKFRRQNCIVTNDILGSLIQSQSKFNFDNDALYGYVGALLLDGIHTSSIPIQTALYELTRNPDVQERLRDEIDEIYEKHNGHLTYEILQEMSYLDRVYKGYCRSTIHFNAFTANNN